MTCHAEDTPWKKALKNLSKLDLRSYLPINDLLSPDYNLGSLSFFRYKDMFLVVPYHGPSFVAGNYRMRDVLGVFILDNDSLYFKTIRRKMVSADELVKLASKIRYLEHRIKINQECFELIDQKVDKSDHPICPSATLSH